MSISVLVVTSLVHIFVRHNCTLSIIRAKAIRFRSIVR